MKMIFKIFKFPYLSGKLSGRLTTAHQVEKPPSEENIDPCIKNILEVPIMKSTNFLDGCTYFWRNYWSVPYHVHFVFTLFYAIISSKQKKII